MERAMSKYAPSLSMLRRAVLVDTQMLLCRCSPSNTGKSLQQSPLLLTALYKRMHRVISEHYSSSACKEEGVRGEGPCKDSSVIRQGNLIMARLPVDLPAFYRMIIAALAEQPGPTTMPAPMVKTASSPVPGPYR